MSAYLVTDKSLSVIAKSIEYWSKQKGQETETEIRKLLNNYHQGYFTTASYGETEVNTEKKLFSKLLEVNLLSLGERYEDIKNWKDTSEEYAFDNKAPIVSIPVLIDLLDNWQYQACEGSANETDFYKLTETLQDKLARKYVEMSKGTDKLWGIDDYKELEEIKGAYAF